MAWFICEETNDAKVEIIGIIGFLTDKNDAQILIIGVTKKSMMPMIPTLVLLDLEEY